MKHENPNLRFRTTNELQRMLLRPETFDPDKLTVNEIEQAGGTIIAKIPRIQGRITRRKKNNSDEYYIELILSSRYDPESKQNRNKKVIIGTDISYYLRGMMMANDQYHEYFNSYGDVLPHILAQWAEEDREKRKAEKLAEQNQTETTKAKPKEQDQAETTQTKPTPKPEEKPLPEPEQEIIPPPEEPDEEKEADEVQIKELRKREEELDRREEELNQFQKELENQRMVSLVKMDQAAESHIELLRNILFRHTEIVEEQAKRRPDKPMSLRQIRTINEILQELVDLFKGSEVEELLHLAEEPDKDGNNPGTTYGEMALLLNAYSSMLEYYTLGRLQTK